MLDNNSDTVIGEIKRVAADQSRTLLDVAREYGFGFQDLKLPNPEIDTWLPKEGQEVILPSKFVLPVAPMKGIVLNIPEMRLYYYPVKKEGELQVVITYPLGIGREGWGTPYIKTYISEKKKNPDWHPPESIRKEHEEAGYPLPRVVKSGPENPLGYFAMRLGSPTYLIHGTNKPYGLGMRVSHGCIRLYPEDIETLFSQVPVKTAVNIINQPYKVGIKGEHIYLEVHPFLVEDSAKFENNLSSVIAQLLSLAKGKKYDLDLERAYAVISKPTGIPVVVGKLLSEHDDLNDKSHHSND